MVELMMIVSMYESIAAWFTPTLLFCLTNIIIATIFLASNKHHDHGDITSTTLTPIARVSSFIDRARSMNISSYTTESQQQHYTPQSKTQNYSSTSRLAKSIFLSSDYVTPPELSQSEESLASQPACPPIFERVKSIKFVNEYKENVFLDTVSNSPSQLARVPSFLDRVKSFKIYPAFKSEPENVNMDLGHNPDHHVIRSKSEKTCEKKLLLVEMKKSRSEVKIAPDEDEDEDEEVEVRRPATARESRDDFDEEVDAKADDFISRFKQQLKLQRLESLVRYNDTLNRRGYK